MTGEGDYTFRLDDAEVTRFRDMAANALAHERDLWALAGLEPGAVVVDLGCGPGATSVLVAGLVGPDGRVVAVDADPEACRRARTLALGAEADVQVLCADAERSGLPDGTADVVLLRNVLVHNGPRVAGLLGAAAHLLRPGGRLLGAEPDVEGLDFGAAAAELEYEHRWAAMMRARGNDPSLGRDGRLPQLLTRHGWSVLASRTWTDELRVVRSPAWAAEEQVVGEGFATRDELETWRGARLAREAHGPLECRLQMCAVVAEAPG